MESLIMLCYNLFEPKYARKSNAIDLGEFRMANATIKQHVPIFISSTYEDMIPYREEVQRHLIRLEQIVKGMEYFGANPQSSLSICLSQVRECKVFIGILGMRYGSIDEESGLSYSQLEYNEAIKNKIPTLIYIMDENYPIPFKNVDIGINAEKLSDFKKVLKKKHTVSFFTTPEDLGQKIVHDLIETLSSIDQIEMRQISNEDNKKAPFAEIYKNYLLRPLKYNGMEGELFIRIDSDFSGSTLKADVLRGFGLEIGDTISNYAYVLDESGNGLLSERRISIYADGERADWLEQVTVGDVICAKVKLAFCLFKEMFQYDNGKVLKDSSYLGLILIKGLSINKIQNK